MTKGATALLLIDNQNAFRNTSHWGRERSNPSYESNITALLSAFRQRKTTSNSSHSPDEVYVIHAFHLSKTPGSPLNRSSAGGEESVDFLPFARPQDGELVFSNSVNSCFIGTQLESMLRARRVARLFVCGLTTDHCVSTTVRMAANLGVVNWKGRDEKGREVEREGSIVLVGDATATFNRGEFGSETVHAVTVESLRGEFAEVMTTEEVVTFLKKEAEMD